MGNAIKSPITSLSDNELLKAFMIFIMLKGVVIITAKFGAAGFNPVISSLYIMFETSQCKEPNSPNLCDYTSTQLNHYVWCYTLAPLVGGLLAGILFLIHAKCVVMSKLKGAVSSVDTPAVS